MTPASSRLLSLWDDVRPGTLVTLRRGALTGEQVERTKAWTASGPFCTGSGVSCIRVDIGGAILSYPLERVSLGWEEPRPGAPVPLAVVLDPPPVVATRGDTAVDALIGAACLLVVSLGVVSIIEAVLR